MFTIQIFVFGARTILNSNTLYESIGSFIANIAVREEK